MLVRWRWTRRKRGQRNWYIRVAHLMVLHRGRVFDPSQDRTAIRAEYERAAQVCAVPKLGRIGMPGMTSYIPIG